MTTASPQFGVTAQVTVIPAFGPGVIINPDVTPGVVQTRVDWRVSKGIGGSASNTCTVRAYNLRPSTRATLGATVKRVINFDDEFAFLDGRLITGADVGGTSTLSTANGFGSIKLQARYQGSSSTASLFEGTAILSPSVHRRNTWITTLEGSDGVLQNNSAIADKFWGSTVPAVEVLDYLVTRVMSSQLATPYPPELAGYQFVGGYDATNFYASDILDQLTALTKTEWWIDDGAVFFSSQGVPLPTPPIILSPSGAPGTTRMLSKPAHTEDGKVLVSALLLPELRPKTPVTVVAAELGGQYWASSVRHEGSNQGTSRVCRTIATLTPLGVLGFL